MQVIHLPHDILDFSLKCRINHQKIGFVPTMGALHQGHYSLVQTARELNDIVVVSIFVNPLQFNNSSDLTNYPRTLASDLEALERLGVDVVYLPSESDMYPQKPEVSVGFGNMAKVMEGQFRPGHFDGVGVVVAKLLHQVFPHRAYFGLKDLQQYLLIKRMTDDLSFPTEIIGLPIVRENSGLAMSSRNRRLSKAGFDTAANIYKGLLKGEESWRSGKSPNETLSSVFDFYKSVNGLDVEYVQIVNPSDLTDVEDNLSQSVAICVAGYVEGIRLIDNLYLR